MDIRALKGAMLAMSAVGWMAMAPAQASTDWPTRPVQMVVVFPPGGSADQIGRLLAPHISEYLGQNVVVENRGGAGGMLGTAAVAGANDHTFAIIFDTHATNAQLYGDAMTFDPIEDFNFVTLIGTAPMAIFAGEKSSFRQAEQVIEASRAGKPISYGSVGTGGLGHLAMANLTQVGDFDWEHIAYPGGGPMHMAVAAGHVDLGITSLLGIMGHVQGGTLVPLAVTTDTRSPILPDVPTVAELGFNVFSAPTWWGMVSPASTRQDIVQKMHEATLHALQQPQVVKRLTEQGVSIVGNTPAAFEAFVQGQMAQWGEVIAQNNIAAGD